MAFLFPYDSFMWDALEMSSRPTKCPLTATPPPNKRDPAHPDFERPRIQTECGPHIFHGRDPGRVRE
jgi:hypothetical protein